jgi:hypothetical protein
MGFNNKLNYEMNVNNYLQPIMPLIVNGAVDLYGFTNIVPALAVKMSSVLGVNDMKLSRGFVYPNPSNNDVSISLKSNGTSNLTISDLTGKIVMNERINLENGTSKVDISALNSGMYLFTVALEDGTTSNFNVVKK